MRDKEPLLLQVGMQKSDGDVNLLGKNRLKKWRCKVSVLLKWWLIILVQPTEHSIYTSKPWQFLIWWFNITYLFVFGISLHSTVHLFWDSVQMLACCLIAKLDVVPPQQRKHWESKQSGRTSVLPIMGRYKGNHWASLRSCHYVK